MSRQDSTDLLMAEREGGVFLVRDSATIQGDYVLCVREDNKVSHYIINKIQQGDQTRYKIGDQMFTDLPALLNFYKVHYLDTTPLIRPAPKRVEKVLAKYDFEGNDPDDLPFRKGEVLTVVSKDEEQWWTARNALGQTGSIPVPYIAKIDDSPGGKQHLVAPANSASPNSSHSSTSSGSHAVNGGGGVKAQQNNADSSSSSTTTARSAKPPNCIQRKLPAYARVKQTRVPSAYDKTALRLEVGEIVTVTKMNITGQWEGKLNGKVGHFPFTHVEFIEGGTDSGIEEHS